MGCTAQQGPRAQDTNQNNCSQLLHIPCCLAFNFWRSKSFVNSCGMGLEHAYSGGMDGFNGFEILITTIFLLVTIFFFHFLLNYFLSL